MYPAHHENLEKFKNYKILKLCTLYVGVSKCLDCPYDPKAVQESPGCLGHRQV